MLSYRLHDTITGAPIGIPIAAPGRWKQSLTAIGSGSHAINLSLTPFSRDQWRDATLHWARTLVCLRDGVPQYAGLIKRRGWDHERKTIQLQTVTVDALLRDRYPFGVGSYLTDPDFIVTNASLRAAIARAIYRVTGEFWGPEWKLPFRFQNMNEAGTFSKTWAKHDWARVSDIISTIQKLEGGPDVAFVPFYSGDLLRWDVLVGNPRVSGPSVDLPLSVRNSRARGLYTDEDGSNMLSGVFNRADGYGADRKIGRAGYFTGRPADAPEMVVRDGAINNVADDDQAIANSSAKAYLDANTWPTKQREFALNVERRSGEDSFPATDLRLGTRFNARFSGDEFEPPFANTLYTIALSFDSSRPHSYTPEVQDL